LEVKPSNGRNCTYMCRFHREGPTQLSLRNQRFLSLRKKIKLPAPIMIRNALDGSGIRDRAAILQNRAGRGRAEINRQIAVYSSVR